jgi:hypothetical protein
MEFLPFQKIPRLSRECVVTEKLDGTNASVYIGDSGEFLTGSRTRWITPEDDNYGFARWAQENKDELLKLGPGHHFGEWWGAGVQRRYGLAEKRFSLFNTHRWSDELGARPACCHVVPVLYQGPFTTYFVEETLKALAEIGSKAAPGFMDPEGIIVYHAASGALFKKTVKGDEEGKHAEAHPPRPKEPRPPKDPSKGGRRVAQLPYEGPDKRKVRVLEPQT